MSRRKDRQRAESGIVFRDGKMVSKEDWYRAHPTLEMRREQQAQVDNAIVHYRTEIGLPYFCTKCGRVHKPNTKIHKNHFGHRKEA